MSRSATKTAAHRRMRGGCNRILHSLSVGWKTPTPKPVKAPVIVEEKKVVSHAGLTVFLTRIKAMRIPSDREVCDLCGQPVDTLGECAQCSLS